MTVARLLHRLHRRHRQRLVLPSDTKDAQLAAPVGDVHFVHARRRHEAVGVEVAHEIERVLLELQHVLRVLVVPAAARQRSLSRLYRP